MLPRHGSYGAEAAQALLDNITLPEFHGKLLVILSGYQEDIELLLGANPGLRSRFDKRRLAFRVWDSDTAVAALTDSASRQGMALTGEAQEECSHMFRQLALLPHYSSPVTVTPCSRPCTRSGPLGWGAGLEKPAC